MITPAAELAFERARQSAPRHPAPLFFEGLARARSGDFERGLALFQAALALTPAGTSYRPMIEQGLTLVGISLAKQRVTPNQGSGGAVTPPQAPARP
jgi:cytochrome c-type biogenesis protein CcmH/NrfG